MIRFYGDMPQSDISYIFLYISVKYQPIIMILGL